jgi:hypothetical protein
LPSPEKIFGLLVSMECNIAGEGGGVIAISREDIPAADKREVRRSIV